MRIVLIICCIFTCGVIFKDLDNVISNISNTQKERQRQIDKILLGE